mmetsp:Transcript_9707/g.34127  ORF Transcript_9707/g.34127 Transcript_9707/m.34127 type:complete len:213 (+) Transcript_9707:3980-4618(+)
MPLSSVFTAAPQYTVLVKSLRTSSFDGAFLWRYSRTGMPGKPMPGPPGNGRRTRAASILPRIGRSKSGSMGAGIGAGITSPMLSTPPPMFPFSSMNSGGSASRSSTSNMTGRSPSAANAMPAASAPSSRAASSSTASAIAMSISIAIAACTSTPPKNSIPAFCAIGAIGGGAAPSAMAMAGIAIGIAPPIASGIGMPRAIIPPMPPPAILSM